VTSPDTVDVDDTLRPCRMTERTFPPHHWPMVNRLADMPIPAYFRIEICQPDGELIAHDVHIETKWPANFAVIGDRDSVARVDAIGCRDMERLVEH
jgi:hypothetical protein